MKTTCLILPEYVISHARVNGKIKNLSSWVTEKYCKEFIIKENLLKQIEKNHKENKLIESLLIKVKDQQELLLEIKSWIAKNKNLFNNGYNKKALYRRCMADIGIAISYENFRICRIDLGLE